MKRSLRRSLGRIDGQFDELLELASRPDVRVEKISGWSVDQHLDHVLKVDRSIARVFEQPEAGALPPLSRIGWVILTTGWIPRGRGKAPGAVAPQPAPPAQLAAQVQEVRDLLAQTLSSEELLADPRAIAPHPLFGGLSAARWVRFVAVHHHHHLKIIRDVERAGSA